eukprot:3541280-Amphidinium_carterae.1
MEGPRQDRVSRSSIRLGVAATPATHWRKTAMDVSVSWCERTRCRFMSHYKSALANPHDSEIIRTSPQIQQARNQAAIRGWRNENGMERQRSPTRKGDNVKNEKMIKQGN